MSQSHNRDLQASHQIVQVLQSAANLAEDILDRVPGIFLLADATGQVLRCNPNAYEAMGAVDQHSNLKLDDLFEGMAEWGAWRALWHRDATESVDFSGTLNQGPLRGRAYLWFLRRFKTQTGEQWTLLIGEDVSQVKSYEQRLARIYHATPLGIFTADRFGKILDGYSRQLAVMLGRDDLATKQITDVFWNPDQVSVSLDEFDQFLDLIHSLGGPWQGIEKRASSQVSVFRFKIPGTHPAFRWYKMSLKAIEMDGVFSEILVVLEDQTEWIEVQERQKEAERQSRAMYELAVKDSLTGLYNRHFINDGVQSLLSSCARGTLGPVSVVMVDIDFFKKINDHYGHAAGDEVLRQVGACIQHQARSNDVPIRFGGEEFMVLITAPCHLAQLFAERLRLAVEKLKFEFQGQTHQVTISLGLAGYRIGESLDALIARADGALYASKNSGRNRTTVDEEDLIRDTPKD